MMRRRGWKGPLLGLSIGIFAALFLWPSTGWLVRSQLRLLIPTLGAKAAWAPVLIDRQTAAASEARSDFNEEASRQQKSLNGLVAGALLGAPALDGPLDESYRQRLQPLMLRFPSQPICRAMALSLSTRWQVRIRRPEVDWIDGSLPKAVGGQSPAPHRDENTPQHLKEFDDDAAVGERIDPNNAFFPVMRAAGEFAAGRDADALASIERASAKPHWDDYSGEALRDELDLYRNIFGTVSGLPRRAIVAAIVLPHLIQIRTATRVAIALAARDEIHGRPDEGLAIRLAVLRCGALMRSQGTQLISCLVGAAVEQTSMMRPGGAEPAIRTPRTSSEAWSAHQLALMRTYLRSVGRIAACSEFEAQSQKIGAVRNVADRLQAVDFEESVWKSGLGWIVGLGMFSAAIWLGVLALVCRVVISRVDPKIASGMVLFCVLVIGFASFWQISSSAGAVVQVTWGFLSDGRPGAMRVMFAFAPGLALATAIIALALVAIVAMQRSLRVGRVLASVLSDWAIPAIALLVFAYGVSVLYTVRQEAALNQTVDRIVQNEGKFLSQGIGANWPN